MHARSWEHVSDTRAVKVHRWTMNMQVAVKVTAEWGGGGEGDTGQVNDGLS